MLALHAGGLYANRPRPLESERLLAGWGWLAVNQLDLLVGGVLRSVNESLPVERSPSSRIKGFALEIESGCWARESSKALMY
jgi:hypothetical protein